MAKSKYLIWLESLQKEYSDRTFITSFGQQAACIKLLADMFEVRCRFEKILNRLEDKSMMLEDEGVDYLYWVNPDNWKRGEVVLAVENLQDIIDINDTSIMPQKYAESLVYSFLDEKANVIRIDTERFQNTASSLFVLDQVVDPQRMEVAINEQLKKLQESLLKIYNIKNKALPDDDYSNFFDSKLTEYKSNFLNKSRLQNMHNTWLNSLDDDMNMDSLQERRIELLLNIFSSGFLDAKRKECHKWKMNDELKFKDYEFEEWNDRMDDAVKYFEALTKLCPFKDNIIDFNQPKRLGRYIMTNNFETLMVNSFFENMVLIQMVQDEMQNLSNPNAPKVKDGGNPAIQFVEQVKHIMLKAEDENGTSKTITARGNGGTYIYNVDGKGFVKVMDELLACHEKEIKEYLGNATSAQAISIKYVAPFIGMVHDTHLYTPKDMPKIDFQDVFAVVYDKDDTSAVSKMSVKHPSEEAENLFEIAKKIMKKHKNS